MNFQSFGQTVKGHSRDLDGKSKGKTEQARKVRAKPVGRNQLGVKMQLSLIKYQKYIYLIILSLLDVTFASGREGIDNPFIALVVSSLFVCVGMWDF